MSSSDIPFSFMNPLRFSRPPASKVLPSSFLANSLPTSFGMPRLEWPCAAASIALCCSGDTDASSVSGFVMPSFSMASSILPTWPIVTPSSIASLPLSAAPSCFTISGLRALKFFVVRPATIGA